ncbi:hypothetical protein ACGFSG_38270 [Streptomyces sp. NPDC048512]|uniref:hypothetical protein n=1 Tax=unclassified Streptomyces TaxID=2593676 RepID=UPI0037185349
MGVFAWLLRRSKATEEASTAEAQAPAGPARTEAEVAVDAKGSSGTGGGATAGTAEAGTTEDVDIPRQQTADQAADNEAGESAHR